MYVHAAVYLCVHVYGYLHMLHGKRALIFAWWFVLLFPLTWCTLFGYICKFLFLHAFVCNIWFLTYDSLDLVCPFHVGMPILTCICCTGDDVTRCPLSRVSLHSCLHSTLSTLHSLHTHTIHVYTHTHTICRSNTQGECLFFFFPCFRVWWLMWCFSSWERFSAFFLVSLTFLHWATW